MIQPRRIFVERGVSGRTYPDHPGDPMSEPSIHEGDREAPGAVQQLVRDDVARKRFLTMAGKRMGAGAGRPGRSYRLRIRRVSSAATSSPDLAIVNYALTLEYLESQFYAKVIKSGLFHGKNLSVIKSFGAEEAQHVPHSRARAKLGRRSRREPERRGPTLAGASRTSAPPPTSARRATSEQGDPGRRSGDPQHRGPPRGDDQPRAGQEPDPRWGVRQADDHVPGPGRRQAVHRLSGDRTFTECNHQ